MVKICYGCMKAKQDSPVCEHCGYDERQRNEPPCLPAGLILKGQYLIGKVLGRGGFGITYLGYDLNLNQPVAIKEFFPKGIVGREIAYSTNVKDYETGVSTNYECLRTRFLKEAQILAMLRSIPQIVHVLNYFQENNTAYIVMEYIEGMDLRKYLHKLGRPMTVEETFSILIPVMEALVKVHEADLIHRDISPDNIMLLPDGSVKLLDFGAARIVETDDVNKRSSSTMAIMKPGFSPPEQYQSRSILGPRTDVYSMCGTIYYCLTGQVPPEAMARINDEIPVGWNHIQGLTYTQKNTLSKGMALSPKERYQTMESFLADLKKLDCAPIDQKKIPKLPITVIAALLSFVIGTVIFFSGKTSDTSIDSEMEVTETISTPGQTYSTKNENMQYPANITCTYRENRTGWTITGYEEPMHSLPSNIILPNEYQGKPVTSIGARSFLNCTVFTSITLPDSITSIEVQAFSGCTALRSISIPNSVTSIGNRSFQGCTNLTSVSLSKNVISIGDYAFQGCIHLAPFPYPDNCKIGTNSIPFSGEEPYSTS